jgi:hypothetical protein
MAIQIYCDAISDYQMGRGRLLLPSILIFETQLKLSRIGFEPSPQTTPVFTIGKSGNS